MKLGLEIAVLLAGSGPSTLDQSGFQPRRPFAHASRPALAGAFVVYIELLKRSWHFGDAYALLSVYFGAALHTLYRRGCQRDQRTRLKPSPFFFWFSR